jgi:tetratricopeptide (TPR) repeat protein
MPTAHEILGLGWRYYQTGDYPRAEQIYRQLLQAIAPNADVLCLLGSACQAQGRLDDAAAAYERALGLHAQHVQARTNLGAVRAAQNRFEEAVACYRQALRADPTLADAHNNLGAGLAKLGRYDEAIAAYREALRLQPSHAEAHNNLGVALTEQKQLDEAIAHYREAVRLKLDYAEAYSNLGAALASQEKLEEAITCYQKALAVKPTHAKALNNLGVALMHKDRADEAVQRFAAAVQSNPENVDAWNNLGTAYATKDRHEEAIRCFQEVIRREPEHSEVYNNLGSVLLKQAGTQLKQGQFDAAVASYERAIAIKPEHAEAHNNLGVVYSLQNRVHEARDWFGKAIALKPDYADAHKNHAFMSIVLGEFTEGWREYEWRWKTKDFTPRSFAQPAWEGESLAGRRILIYPEQGLGDALQFIRYAKLLEQRGATVYFEAPKPLVPLLSRCPYLALVIRAGDELPDFDCHVALVSLPRVFGTTVETVPADVPYLFPDQDLVASWRRELQAFPGFRIGIVWQGSPSYSADKRRSIPLSCFAPLAAIDDVKLISLQKGHGSEQLAAVRDRFAIVDFGDRLDSTGAFMDSAALMKSLDLVITCDTASGHLAGALAVPTWRALSYAPDYRWLYEREDTPWYPTMRLFKQTEHGDWDGVFRRMADELRTLLASRGS